MLLPAFVTPFLRKEGEKNEKNYINITEFVFLSCLFDFSWSKNWKKKKNSHIFW